MRENYKKAFDKLAPKRSDDELLKAVLGKAENNMEKKKLNKKAIIVPVAAALALTVGTVGAVAAINSEHLRSLFGGNESIVENIHNYVFEDSDEHVKMMVEEYLSDGQCTYLTVHYQALDEQGEKWLFEEDFVKSSNGFILDVRPIFKESEDMCYATNWGGVFSELSYLNTATDRYFNVGFEAGDRNYGTHKADFVYLLSDGIERETTFDISENIEAKWYELNAEVSPSEFYIPKYLVLSELSFSIHGENTGAFKDSSVPDRNFWSFTSLMTEEEEDADAVHNIRFVFADGSEYRPDGYAYLCSAVANEENRYTDIDIAGGAFVKCEPNDRGNFEISFDAVDVDNIIGLYIGDVYYELSAE